jgi:Protein of unknown function (DUF3592)
MNGDTFPFVAGCIFFGLGALLILSLLQYLWQRMRWRGRATGSIVAIDTVSAAEGTQAIAKAADAPAPDPASPRCYRPVVAYTVDGQQYQVQGPYSRQPSTTRTTFVGGVASSEIRSGRLQYDTGQTESVGYDRSNPAHAIVIDRTRELTVIALPIFCGLMSMVLGLLAFYMNGNLAWLGPEWHP